MRARFSAVAVGVLGVALAAAGCGSTGNVSGGSSGSSAGTTAAKATWGAQNQKLCSGAANTQPNYKDTVGTVSGGAKTISGAGSTFAAPLYSTWASAYSKATSITVAYGSIGSGGGIAAIQASTVNFGQSDSGMAPADLKLAKGGPILQIPLLLGAVVPTYNLPGVGAGLKFTGSVLGEIFAGKITKWDDPALKKLNPGVKLPDLPIAVAHRSDGSGTTNIWSHYLTQTSPAWVSKLGGPAKSQGLEIAWPTGIGGKGNDGVSAVVSQTKGALGYLESDYAIAQHLTYGQVQNQSGSFIEPCIQTIIPAVNGVTFPANLNTFLTNGSDPDAYPITGTSYALVYQHQTSKAIAAGLVNFFAWVLSDGQNLNASVYYAPLGAALQKKAVAELKKITVNGKPVA
jgi:phosphate transport system substrate-binding protein